MRHQQIMLSALIVVLMATAAKIPASTPRTISYQGRATDAGGNPVPDASYPAQFHLYDRPTGGTDRWSEIFPMVTTSGGLFTYLLGSSAPIPDSLFARYDSLYLEVIFNGIILSPRVPIVSVGYAMRVNAVDGASGGKITGDVNFRGGEIIVGDSTLRANWTGVRIGDGGTPGFEIMLHVERDLNTAGLGWGLYSFLRNAGTGPLYGVQGVVEATTAGAGGQAFGGYFQGKSDASVRVGAYGIALSKNAAIATGSSYGLWGVGAEGLNAYGIYGTTTGTATNEYGGYFSGNLHCTGTLSKGAGSFKIDHPLDPENKYLQHSFVESPDMMNIYNGNVALDANGEALVQLPNWFTALNKDFRYQLTAIGAPGPNLYIAAEVDNNQFKIAGGQPQSRVSWQVTGIRHDNYAEANRIRVEVAKPPQERGTYMHPEAFGLGEERYVNYEQEKAARELVRPSTGRTTSDAQR